MDQSQRPVISIEGISVHEEELAASKSPYIQPCLEAYGELEQLVRGVGGTIDDGFGLAPPEPPDD